MSTLIENWEQQKSSSPKKVKEQIKNLSRHSGKHLNKLANEVHDSVFEEVDCMDCANCCKSIPAIILKQDITRISKHLSMSEAVFQDKYVVIDEDGDRVINSSPCPFLLEDNACDIYDVRPKACKQYPHTNESEFSNNIHLHKINSQYCPAVYYIVQRMNDSIPK